MINYIYSASNYARCCHEKFHERIGTHYTFGPFCGGCNFHPLRAIFFSENINIYLRFMSFLHIDLTQVLKTLPQVIE